MLPVLPLYDETNFQVVPAFNRAVLRIFRMFDQDRDGVLRADSEFQALQSALFFVQLSDNEATVMLQDIQERYPDGVSEAPFGLTPEGLMEIVIACISHNRSDTAWHVLSLFHYAATAPHGKTVSVPRMHVMEGCEEDADAYTESISTTAVRPRYLALFCPDAFVVPLVEPDKTPDVSMELSGHGRKFLEQIFHQYAQDGLLDEDRLDDIFEACPGGQHPFGSIPAGESHLVGSSAKSGKAAGGSSDSSFSVQDPGAELRFPWCVPHSGGTGQLSLESWILSWELLAVVAPRRALEGMYALGFSLGAFELEAAAAMPDLRPADATDVETLPFESVAQLRQSPRWAFRVGHPRKNVPRLDAGGSPIHEPVTYMRDIGQFFPPRTRRIFVVGPSGSGKSTIIQHFLNGTASLEEAPPPRAHVLASAGSGTASPTPSSTTQARPVHYAAPAPSDPEAAEAASGKGAQLEIQARPKHIVITEWPEELLSTAMAVAPVQCDAMVVVVDLSTDTSNAVERIMHMIPDGVPTLAVGTCIHREESFRAAYNHNKVEMERLTSTLEIEWLEFQHPKVKARESHNIFHFATGFSTSPYLCNPATEERRLRWEEEEVSKSQIRRLKQLFLGLTVVAALAAGVYWRHEIADWGRQALRPLKRLLPTRAAGEGPMEKPTPSAPER